MNTELPRGRLHALLLGVVFCASLYFQLVAALETEVVGAIRADAREYVAYAWNLENYGVYSRQPPLGNYVQVPQPDAVRTPGYPLLLRAFLVRGAEPDDAFVRRVVLAQALIGSALCLLAYWLAWLALESRRIALCVAALVAATPQLVTAATYLLSETWYAAWICAALALLLAAQRARARRPAWMAVAGVALGCAALVRPTTLYLPIAIVLVFVVSWGWRPALAPATALLVGFVVAHSPWWLRNLDATGRLQDSTLMAGTILHGSYPRFSHGDAPDQYGAAYRRDPRARAAGEGLPDVLAFVGREFVARPGPMLRWYLFEKPFYFVAWEPIQGVGDVFIYPVARSPFLSRPEFRGIRDVFRVLHWPLMLLAYAGAVLAWIPAVTRRLAPESAIALRLLSATLAYLVAIHVVGAPFPRYSVPFRPLQYVLAIFALMTATSAVRAYRAQGRGPGFRPRQHA